MLRDWQAFQELAKRFAQGEDCLRVAGLAAAARALVIAELLQSQSRPVLVVASIAEAPASPGFEVSAPPPSSSERERGCGRAPSPRGDAERAMMCGLSAGEHPWWCHAGASQPSELLRREGTLRWQWGDSSTASCAEASRVRIRARGAVVEVVSGARRWHRGRVSPIHPSRRGSSSSATTSVDPLFDPTTQRSTGSSTSWWCDLVAVPDTATTPSDAFRLPRDAPWSWTAQTARRTSEEAPGAPARRGHRGRPRRSGSW